MRIHVLSAAAAVEPALTDDQGRFELTLAPQRALRIRIAKAGFVTQIVTSSRLPARLDVTLPRAAVLSGSVVSSSGEPLSASVSLQRSGAVESPTGTRPFFLTQATTNDRGEFRLSGLPAGQYSVKMPGFQSSVSLQRGEESSLAIAGPEPLQLTTLPATVSEIAAEVARSAGEKGLVMMPSGGKGSLRGRVVGSDQQPLPGIHVSLIRTSAGPTVMTAAMFSDGQGVFVIDGLPAGDYRLSLSSQGYALSTADLAAYEKPITLEDGERRELTDFVLRKTAVISGRIMGPTGLPARGIIVRATPGQARTISAEDGRYELTAVAPGALRVTASSSVVGMASTGNGVMVMEGTSRAPSRTGTMTVGEGQRADGVDLVLQSRRVIAGTIVDANGDPVEGLLVQALDLAPASTRSVSAQARTDDRGRYRLQMARPGTYYVTAVDDHPVNERSGPDAAAGTRRYYPGRASLSESVPVRLSTQSDALGVDLVFAPAPGTGVRGFAFQSSGEPIRGTALLMVRSRAGMPTLELQRASIEQGGAFEFLDVPPGDYVVQIIGGSTLGSTREYGVQPVRVDGRETKTLVIQTVAGSTVAGHVVFDGELPSTASAASFKLSVVPADPSASPVGLTPRAVISSSWIFEVNSLFGPARIAATAPDGWWLRSILVDGVNIAETSFDFGVTEETRSDAEVVFASGAATIAGRVVDANGRPVVDATALVFPADAARDIASSQFLRVLRSGAGGSFNAANLRPGEYLAVATDATSDDVRDARAVGVDRLNALLPYARHVTVGVGQRQSVDLTLVENVD
ncbi:MAG TPA: carboxypeptidase regulatory-like domain-containing protein [Vicinamibacterales bacterium]|nr:carboxypeptidase regulatory-like domain-containing protein [Vicinamibacterales bacterium]